MIFWCMSQVQATLDKNLKNKKQFAVHFLWHTCNLETVSRSSNLTWACRRRDINTPITPFWNAAFLLPQSGPQTKEAYTDTHTFLECSNLPPTIWTSNQPVLWGVPSLVCPTVPGKHNHNLDLKHTQQNSTKYKFYNRDLRCCGNHHLLSIVSFQSRASLGVIGSGGGGLCCGLGAMFLVMYVA